MIKKVLIANRGEIACRIIRACKDAGIRTVAVYSDHDRGALHVSLADEAYALGGNTPTESYLRRDLLVQIAKKSGCDGVHPGYGFLAENAHFARDIEAASITFIGPTAEAIEKLGDKTAARRLAQEQGVPTVPGTLEALHSLDQARSIADDIGYPILLKAAAGGGGKGMRVVEHAEALEAALRAARSEAKGAFGDDRVYVEKYVSSPRHVEIQVLADNNGKAIYLGERECSIQRRHQKVLEESPSPAIDEPTRRRMGEAAVALVKAGGYRNAGTVEFIVDAQKNFFFLEVNTRLQVEHPVTEMVTGIDLVAEQLHVASGNPLRISQEDVKPQGSAIECRICAEDPRNRFFPSSGTLDVYSMPSGPFVRVENGFRQGDTIPVFYDSLLAKIITWGPDRGSAIARMARALKECEIQGVDTNVDFCSFVLHHQVFISGNFSTTFIEQYFKPEMLDESQEGDGDAGVVAAALLFRMLQRGVPGKAKTSSRKESLTSWTMQRTLNQR